MFQFDKRTMNMVGGINHHIRHRIIEAIINSGEPLSTAPLQRETSYNVSTILIHLDRLVETGILQVIDSGDDKNVNKYEVSPRGKRFIDLLSSFNYDDAPNS